MTVYRYEQMTCKAVRRVTCCECGRRFTRQRTFTKTVNPFNRNDDGSVRTRQEVQAQTDAAALAWQPEELCGRCTS